MEQKAVWDVDAVRTSCEICAKEANDGNRPTKSLSGTGYKNLIEEFHKHTKRLYTKKQMKNRWDELKGIWTAWVYYTNKATRIEWDPVKQTIIASEEEWASMIKVHKDIKCFQRGPPDNLHLLEDMFQKVNVSRESSVMPGAEEEEIAAVQINEDIVDLENEDEEAPQPSPVAVPKKRGAAAVACSPKKRKKDPYRKDFKRFVDHAISEDLTEVSSNVSVANDIDPMSLQELLSDHEDEDEEDSGGLRRYIVGVIVQLRLNLQRSN